MTEPRVAFGEMTFPSYFQFAVQNEESRQEYIDDTGDQIPDPIADPDGVRAWIDRFKDWSHKHYMTAFTEGDHTHADA